jgi:coenzyme PQQ synthesis protein D (PqqD)
VKLPRAKSTVVFKELSEGALLFSTEEEVYLGLNDVGRRIWSLLPPACNTLEDLVAQLAREYPDAPPDIIRSDVLELLEDLERNGLLEPSHEPA